MTQKEVYTEEFYTVEEVAGLLRVRPFSKVGQVEGLPLRERGTLRTRGHRRFDR